MVSSTQWRSQQHTSENRTWWHHCRPAFYDPSIITSKILADGIHIYNIYIHNKHGPYILITQPFTAFTPYHKVCHNRSGHASPENCCHIQKLKIAETTPLPSSHLVSNAAVLRFTYVAKYLFFLFNTYHTKIVWVTSRDNCLRLNKQAAENETSM